MSCADLRPIKGLGPIPSPSKSYPATIAPLLGKPGIRGTEKRSQLTADIDVDRLLWLGPVDDDFLDQLADLAERLGSVLIL